jgi:two-component system, LytTR family, sensor kinase
MRQPGRLDWRYVLGIWTAVGFALILMAYATHFEKVLSLTPWEHGYSICSQLYRAWIWALLTPVIFEFRREIRKRHPRRLDSIFLHVLAGVTLLVWCNVVRLWVLALTFGGWDLSYYGLDHIFSLLGPFTIVDFCLYWLTLGAAWLYDSNWARTMAEQHEELMRTQLAQAELAALRQQMQPHFLFNSLNAISALVLQEQSERAVDAISLLSKYLRELMAHPSRQQIALRQEFVYADCYLAVEKVRFEDRLVVRFEADENCLDAMVPTLILQPLLENAVKHGVAQRTSPCRVTISGQRVGSALRLTVANDAAEGGRSASETNNHGIGLSATQLRLERTFGSQHKFDYSFGGPNGTLVSIELPLSYQFDQKLTQ